MVKISDFRVFPEVSAIHVKIKSEGGGEILITSE